MRRVVVAGWSGTANLGDELLLAALLRMVRARGAEATVVSRDPTGTRRLHGADAIGLGDLRGLLGALRGSSGLVLGPGGILQDETSPFSLPWHAARSLEARAARRRWVGIGLGAGPLDRRWSSPLVRYALRGHRGIAVRDRASADLLRAAGVTDVVAGSDLVLSLDAPEVPVEDRIVVCLRPHRPGGHRVPLRHLPATELDPARLGAIAAALDRLADETGLPLHLVAMEPGRDDRYHDLVADLLRAPVTVSTPGLSSVLPEIASGRLVVAMRFHAGVGALLAGRPAVLIGYAPKVRSLALEVGRGVALVSDDPAGYAGIPAAARRVAGTGDEVASARERLRAGIEAHTSVLDRLLD